MKYKNIFVTGGTGRIGRHLIKRLVSEGCQVKILTRRDSCQLIEDDHIQFVKGDILNQDLIKQEIRGCDYLFHLAVYQNINDRKKDEFVRVNLEGTKSILNCSMNSGLKKIVYVSTAMVFESTGNIQRDENWVQKTFSENNYIQTKIEALEIVRQAKKIIPIVIVYPSEVIDFNDFSSSLPVGVKKWQKSLWKILGGSIPGGLRARVGNKNRIINYVAVQDLVEGMIQAAEQGSAGEEYLLCGENIKIVDYLVKASKRINSRLWPIRIPLFPLKAVSLLGRGIPLSPIIKLILEHCEMNACFSSEKAKKYIGYNQTLRLK